MSAYALNFFCVFQDLDEEGEEEDEGDIDPTVSFQTCVYRIVWLLSTYALNDDLLNDPVSSTLISVGLGCSTEMKRNEQKHETETRIHSRV